MKKDVNHEKLIMIVKARVVFWERRGPINTIPLLVRHSDHKRISVFGKLTLGISVPPNTPSPINETETGRSISRKRVPANAYAPIYEMEFGRSISCKGQLQNALSSIYETVSRISIFCRPEQ